MRPLSFSAILRLPQFEHAMEHEVEIGTLAPTKTVSLHWAEGASIPGVMFARASHVRLIGGAFTNECASVRDLVCVEPEPCYRVEMDASHVTLEIAQSSLDEL